MDVESHRRIKDSTTVGCLLLLRVRHIKQEWYDRHEPDEFAHLDIQKRYPVTMVAWNCDDTFIVTSQTNLVIKVWNSSDGQLVHELRGHNDEIYVLEAHPRDPRILLSASHDGNLMLWNLLTGKLIRKFYNRVSIRD